MAPFWGRGFRFGGSNGGMGPKLKKRVLGFRASLAAYRGLALIGLGFLGKYSEGATQNWETLRALLSAEGKGLRKGVVSK